jgi:hypothetical protein
MANYDGKLIKEEKRRCSILKQLQIIFLSDLNSMRATRALPTSVASIN